MNATRAALVKGLRDEANALPGSTALTTEDARRIFSAAADLIEADGRPPGQDPTHSALILAEKALAPFDAALCSPRSSQGDGLDESPEGCMLAVGHLWDARDALIVVRSAIEASRDLLPVSAMSANTKAMLGPEEAPAPAGLVLAAKAIADHPLCPDDPSSPSYDDDRYFVRGDAIRKLRRALESFGPSPAGPLAPLREAEIRRLVAAGLITFSFATVKELLDEIDALRSQPSAPTAADTPLHNPGPTLVYYGTYLGAGPGSDGGGPAWRDERGFLLLPQPPAPTADTGSGEGWGEKQATELLANLERAAAIADYTEKSDAIAAYGKLRSTVIRLLSAVRPKDGGAA